ncbi:MAG: hypothetical protein VX498_02950 [Myxococcota bacterium]|nr:hypothetical protein [Myxococcota bacterium]
MARFNLGDEVLAPWARDGFLYPAVLVECGPNKGHVAYLDGDEADVDLAVLRQGIIGPGLAVQVNWKGKRRYYKGIVQQRLGQAVFVHYEDGSREWATIAQCRVHLEVAGLIAESTRACAYCGCGMQAEDPRCPGCAAPPG